MGKPTGFTEDLKLAVTDVMVLFSPASRIREAVVQVAVSNSILKLGNVSMCFS